MKRGSPFICLSVAVLLTGCAGIPERSLENAFHYQRLKQDNQSGAEPVDSVYQELAAKAEASRKQGGTAEYVSLLEHGDDALLARVHLIRAARRSIDVQTFIWKQDPTSRFIFDELVKAAERGVYVRMLIDALNMPGTPEELARMARAHRNLEIALYKPLSDLAEPGTFGFWDNVFFKTRHMNRRMHNKLLLVDGRIGIAGGRNYEGKYYDRDTGFLFRDRDVIVAGPAVMDMQDSFELFWQDKSAVFLTQLLDVQSAFEKLDKEDTLPLSSPEDAWMFQEINSLADARDLSEVRNSIRIQKAQEVRFIYDTPRKFKSNKERMDFDDWFEAILENVDESLVIQTPYLIYNRKIRNALKDIHEKKSGFRIIASSNSLAASDHLHVYALSFKHRKELYKDSGIDIYEAKPYPADRARYVPGIEQIDERAIAEQGGTGQGPVMCIHAKSAVVDHRLSLVGSHNFDPRSNKLNTECGVFILDDDFAAILEASIRNACEPQNAWTVSRAPSVPVISYFSGILGTISSALPFFDIWPYRYTTNYELKEGCEPLSPRDPDFQKNYIDVGYFPEVPDSSTVIQTRLMKAFGGWARPLM